LEAIMQVIHPRCAGLDVHKQTVVACVRSVGDGPPLQEVRAFDTTTSGLLALADRLDSFGVEHVGMEATGVYWKPVWHVLEGHFELVQAAWAAVKVKGGCLQAQLHRPRARRGAKKAIIGVAASMLTAAWHMLRDGAEWHDLGTAHFDRADAQKTANRLIRRLEQIGYAVQITPAAPA
jgi:hypothetical protein